MSSARMPEPTPVFNAELVKVVDGDTIDVVLDRWHGDQSKKRLRLLGVDCPEMRAPGGEEAKAFALGFLTRDVANPLTVQTAKQDRWGRTLAYVWRKRDGACLNTALRDAGHAHAVSVLAQMKEAGEA